MLLLALIQLAGSGPQLPPVALNDNRVVAGVQRGTLREVSLEMRLGDWRPMGPAKPGIPIYLFGETGKPLQNPSPFIRVPLGTRLRLRVHNASDRSLLIHGFSAHQTTVMDTLLVAPGGTGTSEWTADVAGTYYYWGTTTGKAFSDRLPEDWSLTGAIVIEAPGSTWTANDRVFVIGGWTPLAPDSTPNFTLGFMTFNGRPWPFTERLSYQMGDSVRWHFVHALEEIHPLHLHGFYFRVDARGDFQQDTVYWPAQRRMAVTEFVSAGTTLDLVWSPDRPGAWIFHCHLNPHVIPNPGVGPEAETVDQRVSDLLNGFPTHPGESHAETGMGGLVLAMEVQPSPGWKPSTAQRRQLRLYVREDTGTRARHFGYALAEGEGKAWPDSIAASGPPILLHRGEPTSIEIINHTREATQVHWHGMELESYNDGVAGLSGMGAARAPMIMPGDSFEVRMTPPRNGSFMYHTHINDIRQQGGGLSGPLLVLEAGTSFDPTTDHILLAATAPVPPPRFFTVMLNGTAEPEPLTVKAGVPQRFRLMNITTASPELRFSLVRDGGIQGWTALAKDGNDLPPWQQIEVRAELQVSNGEAYDFGVTFAQPGDRAIELRSGGGRLFTRQLIHVVP